MSFAGIWGLNGALAKSFLPVKSDSKCKQNIHENIPCFVVDLESNAISDWPSKVVKPIRFYVYFKCSISLIIAGEYRQIKGFWKLEQLSY